MSKDKDQDEEPVYGPLNLTEKEMVRLVDEANEQISINDENVRKEIAAKRLYARQHPEHAERIEAEIKESEALLKEEYKRLLDKMEKKFPWLDKEIPEEENKKK